MTRPYDDTIDLHTKLGSPPRTWLRLVKTALYWIFPPTLIWGLLTVTANKLLGATLGRMLMKQPKATRENYDVQKIYEIIQTKQEIEPPSSDDIEHYAPRQFYTPDEARAQAVVMDCMDYGKDALNYTADDWEQNPYRAVQVKHKQLIVNKSTRLDTYFCEYDPKQSIDRQALASGERRDTQEITQSDKLIANKNKIAVVFCPGRARSGQFLLPSAIRNALTYCSPSRILKNWRQSFTKDLPKKFGLPNTDLLNDYKPYDALLNVTFDYRGVKDSTGKVTSDDDMVEDIMSIVFHLFSEGYLPENIVLKGHSLGGICTIAAERIQDLLTHLDDPAYQPYFKKLFGREHLDTRQFKAFNNYIQLHGAFVRGSATRSFGNLPWTIANKFSVSFARKGYPRVGQALTWIVAPFLYVFSLITNFNFNITNSFIRLRQKQKPSGFTFFSQKGFKVHALQESSRNTRSATPALGDQTIPHEAALGTLLKTTLIERLHRVVNKFLMWVARFRSHEFESHYNYKVHRELRTFNERVLFLDDKSKELEVDYEATLDNVAYIHDKAPERVKVHGLQYDLEKWFYMHFIPNCRAFTRDYCAKRGENFLSDPDPNEAHQCVETNNYIPEGAFAAYALISDPVMGTGARAYLTKMFQWGVKNCKTLKAHLLRQSESEHECVSPDCSSKVMEHLIAHYKSSSLENEECDSQVPPDMLSASNLLQPVTTAYDTAVPLIAESTEPTNKKPNRFRRYSASF